MPLKFMTFYKNKSDNGDVKKQWIGSLSKMQTHYKDIVRYQLTNEDGVELILNDLIGKNILIKFLNEIHCGHCHKMIKKSYQQGFCYPCTLKLASCDICMVKPELCHYDKGTCREPEWGLKECFQPHIVYLANSTGLKVGITRQTQVPTRWMDQGARQVLPLMRVFDRKSSGVVEKIISSSLNDKSDWRKLITSDAVDVNLNQDALKVLNNLELPKDLKFEKLNEEMLTFKYPIESYPLKAKSFNLEKENEINHTLTGIKGQYLLFEAGALNVRNHAGLKVLIEEK